MMPTLEVVTTNFTGKHGGLNGKRSLDVSKRRLMKFAATIGQPASAASSSHPRHAVALAAYKALAIKAAVEFGSAALGRRTGYESMDPSEKSNISFWIGMTFASLVADECLGVSRMVHVSALSRAGVARVNPSSKRLADLIGQDSQGAWHVVESKARQQASSEADRNDWKSQALTIAAINGVAPTTRSYAFTRVGPIFTVTLNDPEPEEQQPNLTVELGPAAIVQSYYGPVTDFLSEEYVSTGVVRSIERGGRSLTVRLAAYDSIDGEFVFVGMEPRAIAAVKGNELPPPVIPMESADTYLGADGIAIVTSTSAELS